MSNVRRRMKTIDIARLVVDATSGLLVHPNMDGQTSYEYIYREANGLRWAAEKQALHAYEPTRWEPEELLSSPFQKFAHVFFKLPASTAGSVPSDHACGQSRR